MIPEITRNAHKLFLDEIKFNTGLNTSTIISEFNRHLWKEIKISHLRYHHRMLFGLVKLHFRVVEQLLRFKHQ